MLKNSQTYFKNHRKIFRVFGQFSNLWMKAFMPKLRFPLFGLFVVNSLMTEAVII